MKIWKSQLNWLTITAGGLIAPLLLANDVRATASIATTNNSRTLNADPGTGSANANLGGSSNNFGVQGSFSLSPQFAPGAWAGYTQNQLAGADRQI
jgi:hypothetical protein